MGGRRDEAFRVIHAPAAQLWQAWFDPAQLMHWLPPEGMAGEVLMLDPRPGGAFGMNLTYLAEHAQAGKTAPDRDEIGGHFVLVDPPRRFVFESRFRSDDPAFAGVMQMEWLFDPVPGGTRVGVIARDVPPGIGAKDHVAAISMSLAQLAAHVEAPQSGAQKQRDER